MCSESISTLHTKVHYMIAADCAIVDDDVCRLHFIGINQMNFKRSSSPHAHKATAFHYALLCQCEESRGSENLGRPF